MRQFQGQASRQRKEAGLQIDSNGPSFRSTDVDIDIDPFQQTSPIYPDLGGTSSGVQSPDAYVRLQGLADDLQGRSLERITDGVDNVGHGEVDRRQSAEQSGLAVSEDGSGLRGEGGTGGDSDEFEGDHSERMTRGVGDISDCVREGSLLLGDAGGMM